MQDGTIRLNLGAGSLPLPGYIPIDRKTGGECYPLSVPCELWPDGRVPDESVDEIRASHVLEHFSHRHTEDVLREWVRVLKPGGALKLAVPDFDRIIAGRAAGMSWPVESLIMGGHDDDDDVHGAIFDEPTTAALMRKVGLRHVRRWESELRDCASFPISLNLCGVKLPPPDFSGTMAVMTMPRLAFTDNFNCALNVFRDLNITHCFKGGVFWHKGITDAIDKSIKGGAKYVLTTDYDTIFTREAVEDLHRLMDDSGADAICAAQVQRARDRVLMLLDTPTASLSQLQPELVPLKGGHFGLSLLRTEAFAKLPKPWFQSEPDDKGEWGETCTDADMVFWRQWIELGNNIYLAAHVPIGHAQLMVTWPDRSMNPMHQYPDDFHRYGMPPGVRR